MEKWTPDDHICEVTYNKAQKFICVEHPALIKNDIKALSTIGGVETLEKTYDDPMKRLAMSWRPDDFYSKYTYGDRANVSNLILKVCRRRRKSDGKEEYKLEVLGVCETTYRFQAMADFQYLPMKTNKDGTHESIYEKVHINRLVTLQEYMNADVPLFLPPLTFSRSDRPCEFHYKQEIVHKPGYNNPDTNRPPNLIGTVRQRRSLFTIFVNFGEKLPTGPIPEAMQRTKKEFVDPNAEEALIKLFEEKPLYLKVEIEHLTGYRGEKLKVFLPAMCFYWLDGPWRGQWNKFGFDPTTNVSAKLFQTIDFRIRALKPGQMDIKAKRDTLKIYNYNQTFRNQKHNVKISLKSLQDEEPESKHEKIDRELFYKFKPDKVPPQRMMYYPVCYVEIDEIQKLLHENDGKEEKCTAQDGWCVEDFNNRCRDIMYQYLNRLLCIGDTVEHKFWRTKKKKRRVQMVDLDVGEEEGEESEAGLGKDGDVLRLAGLGDDGGVQGLHGQETESGLAEDQGAQWVVEGLGTEVMELEGGASEMEGVVEEQNDESGNTYQVFIEEQMEND